MRSILFVNVMCIFNGHYIFSCIVYLISVLAGGSLHCLSIPAVVIDLSCLSAISTTVAYIPGSPVDQADMFADIITSEVSGMNDMWWAGRGECSPFTRVTYVEKWLMY